MSCDNFGGYDDDDPGEICPECGHQTINGKAVTGCLYPENPLVLDGVEEILGCEACGFKPCLGC